MKMDKFVRERLCSFLQKHAPEASASCVDDVVLDYIVEVLSSLQDGDESSFDVVQLCEMISAYVPEFAQIDSAVVCEWIFEVAQDIKQKEHQPESPHPMEQLIDLPLSASQQDTSLSGSREAPHHLQREKLSTDEIEQKVEQTSLQRDQIQTDDTVDSDNLLLLMEIFPDCAKSDIIKSLKNSNGDLDSCIHSLLENCDQPSRNRQETLLEKEAHASDKKRDLSCVKDDTHLKNTILSKYAFVDTKDDKRSHRPCLPTQEPKKLVRYRDNQVVNTKGERFTVVTKRDQEGEEMKKTYVNVKPLRKYRFH